MKRRNAPRLLRSTGPRRSRTSHSGGGVAPDCGEQAHLVDPIKDGVIRRQQVHELGDLVLGKVRVSQLPRRGSCQGIIYYKNNSTTAPEHHQAGLAIAFAAARGIMYRRALAEGSNRTIPTQWLGSDLPAYYRPGSGRRRDGELS